jgi:aryl-alcohol dehydrogenase-like predicted oxidoreductase
MKSLGISRAKNYSEFISVQAYYSIASRDLERDVFPLLTDQGLGLMVWSPLAGGFLSGKYQRNANAPQGARRSGDFDFPPINKDRAYSCIEAMEPIAKAHGVSIARVALAWVLAKKEVSTVIIGAKTKKQLLDNVGASSLVFSPEEILLLDTVSAIPQEYPGWMLDFQRAYRATPPVKVK